VNQQINEKLEALRRHLDEGKPDIKSVAAKVADMTDRNDHTGARVFLAQTFFPSNKRLLKAWEGLAALQDWQRGLNSGLASVRDELDDALMHLLKNGLSAEDFQAIHDAL
jgi:hypothetical protein